MRWLWVTCLAMLAGVIQVGLLSSLRIGGAVPNLPLVVIVLASLWRTASEALLIAVLSGGIVDLASGGSFGLAISSFVVIALGILALRQLGIHGDRRLWRIAMVMVASVLWALVHILAIDAGAIVSLSVGRLVAAELVINALLVIVIPKRAIGETSTL